MSEITNPIVGSKVLYFPNGVDAQAGTGGATKVPAIVNMTIADEDLTCHMRIFPLDDTGAGLTPQRQNVKHKSIAETEGEGAEAYWDWQES